MSKSRFSSARRDDFDPASTRAPVRRAQAERNVAAALMIGVHVVRKTEDFVSILVAALVGILVTFGPLALQST